MKTNVVPLSWKVQPGPKKYSLLNIIAKVINEWCTKTNQFTNYMGSWWTAAL